MISPAQPASKRRRAKLVWLAAYLVSVTVVVLLVLEVRRTTLREMGTLEARRQWQAWRESEPNRPASGPVERRPPKSAEPPALVLLRDHFGVMLTAAVVFSSLLFAAIMIAARGAFGRSAPPRR
jgi:hypothetical protein